MRLHLRFFLLLLSAFLLCVVYLNLRLGNERDSYNSLPWGKYLRPRQGDDSSLKIPERKNQSPVISQEDTPHSSLFFKEVTFEPSGFYKQQFQRPKKRTSTQYSLPSLGIASHDKHSSKHSSLESSKGTTPSTSLRIRGSNEATSVSGSQPDVASTPADYGADGAVYPSLERYSDDRILQQLQLVPRSVRQKRAEGQAVPMKKILVYSGTGSWGITAGRQLFQEQGCSVQDCELVNDHSKLSEADVVLYQSMPSHHNRENRADQIWALFMLESPHHTQSIANNRGDFNWTATYRHDSTIVAPYEKYVPLNQSQLTRAPVKNYAEGKTKKVAWFVSNCGAPNGRGAYVQELSKHIQVDIYGGCGPLRCPQDEKERCFQMLSTDYKFYLAFENSNCRDYITEKFFINGLKNDVIPIVMGAAPEDYRRAAPPNSFIHVDDFQSVEQLAEYLHRLDKDDKLYNQYFAWKGLWDNINTYFWCRMCAMAHDTEQRGHTWYDDLESWWNGDGVCIGKDSWRQATSEVIGTLAHTDRPLPH